MIKLITAQPIHYTKRLIMYAWPVPCLKLFTLYTVYKVARNTKSYRILGMWLLKLIPHQAHTLTTEISSNRQEQLTAPFARQTIICTLHAFMKTVHATCLWNLCLAEMVGSVFSKIGSMVKSYFRAVVFRSTTIENYKETIVTIMYLVPVNLSCV